MGEATPDVRLAFHPEGGATLAAPDVRLAFNPGPAQAYPGLSGAAAPPPAVRLALPMADGETAACGPVNIGRALRGPENRPALLVSYVYLDPFLKHRGSYHYRDWVLDSGAFSAHASGTVIDLQAFIATAKRLQETDPTLSEVFALDVIGDWEASRRNTDAMWAAGVPAIPTYHVGEPEHVLLDLARTFPKIALGGAVGYRKKDEWAAQCFARVWPKRIHGFGFGGEASILALPWHSVDATNWEAGPCRFGNWRAFGKLSVRGSKQDLRAEVEWYLELERRARARWASTWAKVGPALAERERETGGPTVRLAVQSKAVPRFDSLMPPAPPPDVGQRSEGPHE